MRLLASLSRVPPGRRAGVVVCALQLFAPLIAALGPSACESEARSPAARPDGGVPGDPNVGRIKLRVLDADSGEVIACKLSLEATPRERTPFYGTDAVGFPLGPNQFGVRDVVYAERCDYTLSLPVGPMRITASQGIEREIASAELVIEPDRELPVTLMLARAFDSRNVACAEFHVHSAPSFDSDVPIEQRVISALAEGLDAMAPTDHDVVIDWEAELAATTLAGALEGRLTLILGNEVTPDIWSTPQAIGHFGVFPVPVDMDATNYQLGYQTQGGLIERLDGLFPDSLIQCNHPRWGAIGYLNNAAFDPLDPKQGERLGLSHLDAIELWNAHEVDAAGGGGTPLEATLHDYFALLDLGYPLVATGNSDSHELSRQPLGYPRNCIRVDGDSPGGLSERAILDGLGLGRVVVTSGPWLEVSLDGRGPGESVVRPAAPVLELVVDGASWVPIDRAQVVVNGEVVATREIRERPAQLSIPLPLPEAASYVMVTVEGDRPLPPVAGTPLFPLRSFAFSNPIWVMPR